MWISCFLLNSAHYGHIHGYILLLSYGVENDTVSRDEGVQRQPGNRVYLRKIPVVSEGQWTNKAEGICKDYLQRSSVTCRHRKTFQ